MAEVTGNKAIAKNTILLYIRMLVTMVISLYTSRVILNTLGVDDYGIYQAVGGIVGMLAIVNNALSTGTSRFITYGLGEGDEVKLKKIFSTTLTTHIVLALTIVILAETAGLWFLHNKMVIPPDRYEAAQFAFHFSIITAFVSLTQVPYNACIIAHERMNVYAYASIVEAVLKLIIVFLLTIGDVDKLKLYAALYCLVHVCVMLFYRFYCSGHFAEAHYKVSFDKKIFKEVAGFSGWSMVAATASAFNGQGILILLNMFFAPAIVTARSISIQVNTAANQFMTSFQTAAIPQIVKRYANKDYEGSRNLLLDTTKYSFFLMLLICLPIFLTADTLLSLWLGVVPDYTVVFLRLIVVQSLFQVFDTSFYYALYAKGRLRENALISPVLSFISFPIVYVLFKLGFSPVALSWAGIITFAFLGLFVKPLLIIKIVNYTWTDIWSVYIPCAKVALASVPLPVIVFLWLKSTQLNQFVLFAILVLVSIISVCIGCWSIGFSSELRNKILSLIKTKMRTIRS